MILHQFFHGKISNPVQAGINTAGKFYECMHVMKKIVLHALELEKNKNGQETVKKNSSKTGSREAKVAVEHRMELETPLPEHTRAPPALAPSLVGPTGGSTHMERTSRFTQPLAMENQELETLLPVWMDRTRAPIPIHMGPKGGSPHMESISGNITQPLTVKNETPQPVWSVHAPIPTHVGPSKGGFSHSERSGFSSSLSRHSSGLGSMQDEGSSARLDWNDSTPSFPASAVSAIPTARDYMHTQEIPPLKRHPEDGHRAPLNESNRIWNEANSSPYEPVTSPISSRETGTKALLEKQAVLHQSKLARQKLTRDVQLLNLRVLEEQLVNELSDVKEKVVLQHIQVNMALRSELGPEQLNSEKIIEQQLRVKQSKLYQKLVNVAQQIRAVSAAIDEEVPASANPSSVTPRAAGSRDLGQRVSRRVKKELEQQQTIVEDQIETLRMLELEKNLELKEEATKRKIQALKNKLLTSHEVPAGKMGKGGVMSQHGGRGEAWAEQRPARDTLTGDSLYANPQLPPGKDYVTPPKVRTTLSPFNNVDQVPPSLNHMTPPRSSSIDHMTPPQSSASSSSNGHLSSSSSPSHMMTPSTGHVKPSNSHMTPQTGHLTPSTGHMTPQTGHVTPLSGHMTPSTGHMTPSTGHTTLSTSHTTPSTGHMTPQTRHMTPLTPSTGHVTPSTGHMTSPSPTRAKLTLPEEVKETEYMSAVQKQRVRVSKIRRCIVAATVIQRAWRQRRNQQLT